MSSATMLISRVANVSPLLCLAEAMWDPMIDDVVDVVEHEHVVEIHYIVEHVIFSVCD